MMESGRGLARVIQQLQDEIRKLETENKALRGQLSLPLTETSPTDSQLREGTPEIHANLRRNVSVPALEDQYKGKRVQSEKQTRALISLWRGYSSSPLPDADWKKSFIFNCPVLPTFLKIRVLRFL